MRQRGTRNFNGRGQVGFSPGRRRPSSPVLSPGKNNRSSSKRLGAVVFVVVVLLGLILVGRGVDALVERLFFTRLAHEGTIQVMARGDALAIRDERVYPAKARGVFTRLVPEGDRVRQDMVVGVVEDQEGAQKLQHRLTQIQDRLADLNQPPLWQEMAGVTKDKASRQQQEIQELTREEQKITKLLKECQYTVYTLEAGMVSYYTDNLEGTLIPQLVVRPGVRADLVTQLGKLKPRPHESKDGGKVQPGDRLFKVVDNHRLWLVVDIPAPPVILSRGDRVWVNISPGGKGEAQLYPATVTGVSPQGNRKNQVAILEIAEYKASFNSLRRLKISVIYGNYQGVLIPRTALVKRGDGWGVYLRDEGISRYTAVTLVGMDSRRAAVTGIPDGARIIVRP